MAFIARPAIARRILDHLGLDSTGPPAWLLLSLAIAGCQTGTAQGSASPVPRAEAVLASGSVRMAGWTATYVTEGTGRQCLVLSLRHYHPRTFSPRFKSELRCTFLDVRFSVPEAPADPKAPYTVAAAVEDVEAARKALGLTRFVIVGHSIQGSMALAYALRYPQHVTHVIAIGALPELSEGQEKVTAEYWSREATSERKATFARAQARLTQEALAGKGPAEQLLASIRADAAKRWYDPGFDESPLLAGAPFNLPVLEQLVSRPFALFTGDARLEPPVFLAVGRADFEAPPASWDGVRGRFRDLTFQVFERSGHTPQVEEADLFDRRVGDWLRSR